MKSNQIIQYHSAIFQSETNPFEEAFYHSTLQYSLQHLAFIEKVAHRKIIEALQKSVQICQLANINSKHHFKQIFIYDSKTETVYVDWLMSKTGFNLMLLNISSLNQRKAFWLWQLANK